MRTVLVVSPDEVLRARLLREMQDRSIFSASSDEEALKTLRFTEIDLIFKTVVPPSAEFPAFVARVRNLGPATVVVAVLPTNSTGTDDEAAVEVADFVLFQPFTSRQVQGVLRQAEEKLLLLQEVSALRLSRRGGGGFPVQEYPVTNPEVSSHSLTQVVKEFAKALAAGFDLPRVLNLFLDAVSEMARPSRSAILLADSIRCGRPAAWPPISSNRSASRPTMVFPCGWPRRADSSRSTSCRSVSWTPPLARSSAN